jgi:hypothetical protein
VAVRSSWPPGTGTVASIGSAALLAGITIAATTTTVPWQIIGYGIAALSVPGSLGAVRVLALQHDERRRTRRRARAIVHGLLAEGKRLHHSRGFLNDDGGSCNAYQVLTTSSDTIFEQTSEGLVLKVDLTPPPLPPRVREFISKVEDWRTTVGLKLRGSPFTTATDLYVLDQTGNRLDIPLNRLREVLADLDRWVDYEGTGR